MFNIINDLTHSSLFAKIFSIKTKKNLVLFFITTRYINETIIKYCIHKFEYVFETMSNHENIFYKLHRKIPASIPIFDGNLNFSVTNNCDRKSMETVLFVPLLYFLYWVVYLRKSRRSVSATNLEIIF